MAKRKRWGPKRIYSRNWIDYNEELVVRGEFFLDFDWVKSWDDELKQMNDNKPGRRFLFPNSLVELQAVFHQWIDLRGIEGISRKFAEFGLIPTYNDYTTISRRINKINVKFEMPTNRKVIVGTDGSGMKMNNAGEYKESKYGRGKKKFLKVTITADAIDKSIYCVDVHVDGEGPSEPKIASEHLKELEENGVEVEKFLGDGAFDTKELFNQLDKSNTEPAIKIRKNASTDNARGSIPRKKEVIQYKKKGYKRWAKEKGYGMRWPCTEGIFSAVKRKFGEKTRSKTIENMCKEVKRRFWAYENMKNYARV